MAVTVETAGPLRLGTPKRLFSAAETNNLILGSGFHSFDVLPDGTGFVMMQAAGDAARHRARLVYSENWYAAYRKDSD